MIVLLSLKMGRLLGKHLMIPKFSLVLIFTMMSLDGEIGKWIINDSLYQ